MVLLRRAIGFTSLLVVISSAVNGQLKWQPVDTSFGKLPSSVKVYKTTDPLGGKPNIAYYVIADLNDESLYFETDTALNRRLTPLEFYTKGYDPYEIKDEPHIFPIVVVNTTFFSFATNQNLNTVVSNGKLVGYNIHSLPARGKDTLTYRHTLAGAIGISKKRKPDVAWLFTDSSGKNPFALQQPLPVYRDSSDKLSLRDVKKKLRKEGAGQRLQKWKMQVALGGGPVLLQEGQIKITNDEEYRFPGKAIDDRHPRTAMGYTGDNKLIILVVEGRNTGIAEGASLNHLAQIMKDLGCIEALNLDGGGSSCMLINGKTTIRPSDREARQRPVPGVFTIKKK